MARLRKRETYKFIDVETGKSRFFNFETMMQADAAGFIMVDGKEYRRDRPGRERKRASQEAGAGKRIVSDSLGFCASQIDAFEADRKANGFGGVEFKRDADVPDFIQVHFDSQKTWERYVKHRNKVDMNSRNGSGVIIDAEQFKKAAEMASRTAKK